MSKEKKSLFKLFLAFYAFFGNTNKDCQNLSFSATKLKATSCQPMSIAYWSFINSIGQFDTIELILKFYWLICYYGAYSHKLAKRIVQNHKWANRICAKEISSDSIGPFVAMEVYSIFIGQTVVMEIFSNSIG